MNCLFCFDKSSSQECTPGPGLHTLRKDLDKNLVGRGNSYSIVEDKDRMHVASFQGSNFCCGCKEKIIRAKFLLEEVEKLQQAIFSLKEEFELNLRDSYLEYNKSFERGHNNNFKLGNDYTHEFREVLLRHLKLVVDIDVDSLQPDVLDSITKNDDGEVAQVYSNSGKDFFPKTEGVTVDLNSSFDEKSQDDTYNNEECPASPPSLSSNAESTIIFNSASVTDSTIDSQAYKELRVIITRLSKKKIESIRPKKVDEEKVSNGARTLQYYARRSRMLAEGRIKCTFENCKCTFLNESTKRGHIRLFHKTGNNHLQVQNQNVSTKTEPRDLHSSRIPRAYDNCIVTFAEENKLNPHIRYNHEGINPYLCLDKKCDQSFRNRQLLTVHLKREHPNLKERYHNCPFCPKKFHSRTLLNQHRHEIHPGMKFFKHCSEKFKSVCGPKQELQQSVICPHCGKSFSSPALLRNHLIWHKEKKFKCSICKTKAFVRQSDLRRHELIHSLHKPFICEYCGKCFRSKSTHLVHTQSVCGDKKGVRRFPCDDCDMVYKNERSLVWHKKKHEGTVEYPFKCDLCDHRVRFKSMIELHRKSHFEERNHQCDKCPARFKHKNSLNLHYDVRHLGKRGKKCGICGYLGIDKQSLNNHFRTHTNETPFQCDCGKQFKRAHHLTRHQKNVHKGKDFKPKLPQQPLSNKKHNDSFEYGEKELVIAIAENEVGDDNESDPVGSLVNDPEPGQNNLIVQQSFSQGFQVEEKIFLENNLEITILEPPEASNEVSL